MEGVTVKVDYLALAKEFEMFISSNAQIMAEIDNVVKTFFQRNKETMLREFNQHPITQELRDGPEAENISNTLNGQEGNLYSFLGFFFGKDPTKDLENLLQTDTTIRKSTRRGTTFYYSIYTPDRDEITNVTRMDWGAGTSWALAVENGDFGGDAALSHYIYKEYLAGRSQQAVQVKGVYSENDFAPRPYLTEILEHFAVRMNNLNV